VNQTGRQAERTALAHWRTELAIAAVAGLIVRQADPGYERVLTVTVSLVAVTAAVAAGWWRYHVLVRRDEGVSRRALGITLTAVLALQVVGLVVIL
jgi:hypothetical protein